VKNRPLSVAAMTRAEQEKDKEACFCNDPAVFKKRVHIFSLTFCLSLLSQIKSFSQTDSKSWRRMVTVADMKTF
jgi:hypothetical protein